MASQTDHNLDEIVKSIGQFRIPGWIGLTAEEIKIKSIGDGFLNTTLKVDKVQGDCNNNQESKGPSAVIYKKYGGAFFVARAREMGVEINSPLVQSLIFHEQSSRGWGPRLYGLMEDVRIEEFVEGHTLTAEESFTPEFIQDIAKAYARFHSLKLPIKKEESRFTTQLMLSVREGRKQVEKFLEKQQIDEPHPYMSFKRLCEFSFEEEGEWLNSTRRKIKQRKVLCTMDANYLNRLVRKEKPSDPNATRVLIIDFDSSSYYDRGFDLGGHFVSRMLDWGGKESKISGLTYPSESQRTDFLTAYLKEHAKLISDFDKESLDSLENLTLEVDLNAPAFAITFLVIGFQILGFLESRPEMLTFIDPMMEIYKDLKKQFCTKYPDLVAY